MLPGPDIIRACPACGGQLTEPTLMSGNTFGAAYWSDGRRVAPMLPDSPRAVKCPHCRAVFWISEAEELGEQYRYKFPGIPDEALKNKFPDARAPLAMNEEDYLNFIDAHEHSAEDEHYLRLHAWWAHNDRIRPEHNPYGDFPDKPSAGQRLKERVFGKADRENAATAIPPSRFSWRMLANLRALSDLLDEAVPKQRLMKAEIARESGDFAECERLLSVAWDDKLAVVRDLLLQKCRAGATELFRIG